MIELLNLKQKETYFDFLDNKQRLYPDILKLANAANKKFILSPYFLGGVEASLTRELDVYVKGYVSYRPYYDFWNHMIKDPNLILKGVNFFLQDLGSHNLEFLQNQVNDHFDSLYRATLCYVLNKITNEGTITCGTLDKNFARLNRKAVDRIANFEYNGRFAVEMLDWEFLNSQNENSLLLLLPNELYRGLSDTGNNIAEKSLLNFSKIRRFTARKDSKIILACKTRKSMLPLLENKFDVIKFNETEDRIGIIAHNV